MKKSDLKKILKPLVKECIKEALVEEGLLSNVIAEVVKGLSTPLVEEKENNVQQINEQQKLKEDHKRLEKIRETKRKMLEAVGESAYNGIDLFEGTTPMRTTDSSSTSMTDPLGSVEPGDPGVDISVLMERKNVWKKLAGN